MIFNDAKIRELFTKMGRTYAPDTIVFLEQEKGDEMYIIVTGEVEISKTFKEQEIFGQARLTLGSISETIAILKAGDFFGEMALWNDEPRMATARARTMVEVIVLSKTDIERLVMVSPALATQMLKSLCHRLREVSQSPRLDTALPEIQKMMAQLQSRRVAGAMPPQPSYSPKRDPEEKGRPARPLDDVSLVVADDAAGAMARRCAPCGYAARFSDVYCGRCGKKLDANGA